MGGFWGSSAQKKKFELLEIILNISSQIQNWFVVGFFFFKGIMRQNKKFKSHSNYVVSKKILGSCCILEPTHADAQPQPHTFEAHKPAYREEDHEARAH